MNRLTIIAVAASFTFGVLTTLYFSSSEPVNPEPMASMEHDMGTMGSTSMSISMNGMTEELEGKTGNALDLAFIEGMIEHHKGAVAMAEMVVNETKRPELKAMAEAIITTQTEEITTMEEWLKQWYGR